MVFFKLIKLLKIKLKIVVLLIPVLLFSDQLMAKETRLLILGDSLSAGYGISQTEGWVSLLQDMWQGKSITIINGAISGETTDGALARLPRLLEQNKPTHVYIELGGNDGLQGHPVGKMMENLDSIISQSIDSGAAVFLQAMAIPTNYGKRYTDMFSAAYESLASKHRVPLIPFFLQNIALNKKLMQADGIHPNAEAQAIIAKDMEKILGDLILSSRTDNKQLH
ncbi:arylesterase [Flavobacterium sp. W21_SRS_FM6]|uniref:arylesterase n=1 Tax=Flavobacterium sp. W21_SRS_FM6 TaxID=3240268 RepID=UPI003F8E9C9F